MSEGIPKEQMTRSWRAVNWGAVVVVGMIGLVAGMLIDVTAPPSEGGASEQEGVVEGNATTWTCSMHPQVQQSEPGTCPLCGMDLVEGSGGAGAEALEPNQVQLDERAQKLARIRTVEVRARGAEGEVKQLLGRVAAAESELKTVTAWTAGRLERLRVASSGERVRRGQPIAEIYSPEIYAAHRELLALRERLSRTEAAAGPGVESTMRAVRRKLELLGMSDAQLDRMEQADGPWERVSVRSPVGGTVLDVLVEEGSYVDAGSVIYRVADLSTLWVELDAYESDLSSIEVGQRVELEVASLAGERFEGEVSFVDPVLDARTRTAQVRVVVDNDRGRLRPGMWAEATLLARGDDLSSAKAPLVIPETAPLFSGRRSLVYVEVPDTRTPTYEARDVKLGARVGNSYPVIAGLEQGERVVIHGAFVLDADLQIRGGKSLMTRPDDRSLQAIDRAMRVDAVFREELAPIFRAYLQMQRALAQDDLEVARDAGAQMLAACRGFEGEASGRAMRAFRNLRTQLEARVAAFVDARDLDPARAAFEDITHQMKLLLEHFGNPLDEPLRLAYCPMAFDNRGAEWLQTQPEVDNAYFGDEMRRCGEFRGTVGQGVHLSQSVGD